MLDYQFIFTNKYKDKEKHSSFINEFEYKIIFSVRYHKIYLRDHLIYLCLYN